MDAFVADAANHRPLFHFKHDDARVGTVRRRLYSQPYVFKELRIPQRLKIAAQSFFIVGISFPGEDARFQGVAADAPVPKEVDALDHQVLLLALALLGKSRMLLEARFTGFFIECRYKQILRGSRNGGGADWGVLGNFRGR